MKKILIHEVSMKMNENRCRLVAKWLIHPLRSFCNHPAESTNIAHTFLMEIYSACFILFCFYFILHPQASPPVFHLGKTIRREESFFNSHIHTKNIFSLSSHSPKPVVPLLEAKQLLLFFISECLFYCWWLRVAGAAEGVSEKWNRSSKFEGFHLQQHDCSLSANHFRLLSHSGGNNSRIIPCRDIKTLNTSSGNENSSTKTHKMEIEKHYTSNCEKIVKCGWLSHPLSAPFQLPWKASRVTSEYHSFSRSDTRYT